MLLNISHTAIDKHISPTKTSQVILGRQNTNPQVEPQLGLPAQCSTVQQNSPSVLTAISLIFGISSGVPAPLAPRTNSCQDWLRGKAATCWGRSTAIPAAGHFNFYFLEVFDQVQVDKQIFLFGNILMWIYCIKILCNINILRNIFVNTFCIHGGWSACNSPS